MFLADVFFANLLVMDIWFAWFSIQKWNFFSRCDLAAARELTCLCPPEHSIAARWALQGGGRSAQVKSSCLWEMLWVCGPGDRDESVDSTSGDCSTLRNTGAFFQLEQT